MTRNVTIQAAEITDSISFHRVFAELFGFPDYYGHNLDAWVDCMTDIPAKDEVVVMRVEGSEDLQRRLPEVWKALVECVDDVNQRLKKGNDRAELVLLRL